MRFTPFSAQQSGAGKGETGVLWCAGLAWPALPDRDVHSPLNFLSEIDRDFVATRYLRQSAGSSPPAPSSSTSTLSKGSSHSLVRYLTVIRAKDEPEYGLTHLRVTLQTHRASNHL